MIQTFRVLAVLTVAWSFAAWAFAAGEPQQTTNTLGMKLTLIAPGEFLMGSPEAEEGRSDDEPQHKVRITRAFYLGQHEVTVRQFRQFVLATGYRTEIERGVKPGFGYDPAKKFIDILPKFTWRDNGLSQTDEHPVINVTFHDAMAFCRWLSAQEEVKYRLPTEAEWEYACRAGTKTPYSSGETEATLREYANLADASFLERYPDATWSIDWNDNHPFTAPVGSFKPNAFGLFDMHGNVWEWCGDWYGKDYTANSPVDDPKGPEAGELRVVRGGSFTNRSRLLRSADRDSFRPKYRYNFTGFRVVREVPGEVPGEAAGQASARPRIEPQVQPLFISGEHGYGRYRIPALIVSAEGTLLAICEGRRKAAGLTGDIDLVLRRSTDDGQTWQPLQVISDDGPNTLGNPCPIVDRSTGTIWLPFTRSPGQDLESQIVDGKSSGTTTVWLTKSTDDGQTWAKPIEITLQTKKADWTWYGTGPGVGLQLAGGRLVIPSYHAESGTKMYRSHMIYSDDHGATWKLGDAVGTDTSECQAVERSDGSLVLNARSLKQPFRTVATSRDGGQTWSEPALDQNLSDPNCQGCLYRFTQPDNSSGWLFSNPPGPKRKDLTVRLSRDEGRTWPQAQVLQTGTAEYSCLATLPDGQIGCLYERSPAEKYSVEILFAKFPIAWLTQ